MRLRAFRFAFWIDGSRLADLPKIDMNVRDEIIGWLRDAYAMERGAEFALEKMSVNGESIGCRTAAALHLTETRQHSRDVESMLRSLGADISSFEAGFGMMADRMKGLGTALSHDESIKDLLDGYEMEHFEIACYSALAAAADFAGLSHIADTCRQIILDEERMAEVIRKELPRAVHEHLAAAALAKAA